MGNLLYFMALVLIVTWAIGFLTYSGSAAIHILLVFAFLAVILRELKGDKI